MSKKKATKVPVSDEQKKAEAAKIRMEKFQEDTARKNPSIQSFDLTCPVRMSDIFDDFVAPFYRGKGMPLNEIRSVMGLAHVAWNISLNEGELTPELCARLLPGEPHPSDRRIKASLEEMIARKHAHFEDVRRIIVNVNFDGDNLQVAHHEFKPAE